MPYCMISQCPDYQSPRVRQHLQQHLEKIPNLSQRIKSGDRILLKPNLIAPKGPEKPAQTHPNIILEMARLFKDYGAKPVIGDSPAWGSAQQCGQALGLTEPLKQLDIPLITLKRGRFRRLGHPPHWVYMSIDALEADAVINLPKFKAHQQLTATLAIKNMFGCVVGKQKPFWHYAQGKSLLQFGHFLLDICQAVHPMFTLIDAVVAMQGPGPINGWPYPMGLLISGTDPVTCEQACIHLLKQPPALFPVYNAIRKRNLLHDTIDKIDWPELSPNMLSTPDFQFPKPIALRFSLSRVVKSTLTGMLIRLKKLTKTSSE